MNKTVNLMVMLVLACSMSAMAQTNTPSGTSTKKEMSGKKMSMTGCVSEKDGKYMMMNKEHPDGVMLMGSEDMKPHVGHMVKVMGMMDPDSKSGDKMMGMKVSSMKMMSEHCDASAQ